MYMLEFLQSKRRQTLVCRYNESPSCWVLIRQKRPFLLLAFSHGGGIQQHCMYMTVNHFKVIMVAAVVLGLINLLLWDVAGSRSCFAKAVLLWRYKVTFHLINTFPATWKDGVRRVSWEWAGMRWEWWKQKRIKTKATQDKNMRGESAR